MCNRKKKQNKAISAKSNLTNKNFLINLIIVAFYMLIGMTAYETLKDIIFPNISIWQSHIITIFFSTFCSVIAAYIIMQKYADQNNKLITKIHENELLKKELEKKIEQFRTLLEKHNAVMLLIDPETGKIIFANKAAERYYGYTSKEFESLLIYQINQLSKEQIDQDMANAYDQKHNCFSFQHKLSNGEIRDVEVHSSPIPFKGKVILFSIVHDITERQQIQKELQESEKRYRTLSDSMGEGYLRADPQGNIIMANPAIAKMCGYTSPEEMMGMHMATLQNISRKERERIVHSLKEKGVFKNFEMNLRTKEGGHFWTSSNIRAITDENGVFRGTEGLIRDITEIKKAEEELRRIEWLLSKNIDSKLPKNAPYAPPYGDVTGLNTCRVILDAVGKETLEWICTDPIDLLDTSVAVYEKNGDYAFGLFSSGWCRLLDASSRSLCGMADNKTALNCGKWLCHENCWNDSAKLAIKTEQPTDIECIGGIHLYAVPIFADNEVIGAINIGYGDPPDDDSALNILAERFKIDIDRLRATAMQYESRPSYMVDLSKKRLHIAAALIGAIVDQKKIENELRFAKDFSDNLIQTANAMVIGLDTNGKIIIFNKRAEEVTGYSMPELQNQNWFEVIVPKNRYPQVWSIFEKFMFHELPRKFENPILTKSGEERYILWQNNEIYEKEKIVGTISFGIDITERKQAEDAIREREYQLRAIGDNLPYAQIYQLMIKPDKTAQFTYVSEQVENLHECTVEEVLSNPYLLFNRVVAEDVDAWTKATEKSITEMSVFDHTMRICRKSGEIRWHRMISKPRKLKNGVILYDGIDMDITEQKQIEKALRHAKKSAESATLAKSEFLANMSHEIRTPINAMLGFLQILKEQYVGHLNEIQVNYIDNVIESTNRLLFLINDILDLSKVEAGKIEIILAPFRFGHFVERLKQTLLALSNKKRITTKMSVSPDIPNYLIGDEYRIEQILKNLISNAVKFTDKGHIDVSIEKQPNDELLFKVSDTGIGIPINQQNRIFNKFCQADNSCTKQYSGTGLGLAISKELTELMNGRIWFDSEAGKGSTFYVALKFKHSEDQTICLNDQNEAIVNAEEIRRSFKILLAEDDELNRESMSYFLKREGHVLTFARNGKEVLKALEEEGFDIILMDIQMPEMGGIEATRQIRASTSSKFNPQMPIIALTAYAMKGDRERFLNAGMNDYITKPVDIDLLMEKINQLVLSIDVEKTVYQKSMPLVSNSIKEIEDFLTKTSEHVEFGTKMLNAFLQEAPVRRKTLHCGFSNKDITLIAAMAHKMANLFSSIHLSSLGSICKDLEGAARENDFEKCNQLLDEINKGSDEVIEYIKGHFVLE